MSDVGFELSEYGGPDDIFDGDEARQIEAMVDYLLYPTPVPDPTAE